MRPEKSAEVVAELNTVAAEVYPRVERHLTETGVLAEIASEITPEARSALVANLIGFVIQSYDAGRGLLSNTLLQVLNHGAEHRVDEAYLRRAVVESLRFDPAIHNTRRVMREDKTVEGQALKAGEAVLVVLAAANRDPQVFEHPQQFDVDRDNNSEHLTFGAGVHSCAAKHHMVELTVDVLVYLFTRFPNVALLEETLAYEPLVNARLPKKMMLSFSV
jgi:cytochrome P450